jgi:serine/threonine-protein kinase
MAVPRVDRRTFLAHLCQSGLVPPEQLAAVAPRLPDSPRGRVVARALVAEGLLTRFQAEQLLAGRTGGFLLGQYRILEQLGQGGMGRVFKAEHRSLGCLRALKVLRPSLLETPRALEQFQREVRAVAQLVHPNIVSAYDADLVSGRYYLVLEYVNGPSLDQLVRAQGPLPVGQACDFIRQVAAGLQHAHERGMVHRDVKPSNILLQQLGDRPGGYGLAKLSDFGLVHVEESARPAGRRRSTILTRPNTVMGTPDYLSPEQARDLHQTDIRSDLYSLGCTFYFLLTGQVPFPGGSALEKLVRHSTEEPVPVESLCPDLPAGVAGIVRTLMAKQPWDRFQSPAELIDALEPFAVRSPAAWAAPEPADPFADPLPTPPADEDAAGLDGTLPSDLSATPVSVGGGVSAPPRRWWGALFLSLGIVGGLLAAGAALAGLLGGR